MTYADLMRPRSQREPWGTRQVMNNAGGHVFALDAQARLDRFLVLGSDAPAYYQSARALTRENAAAVAEALAADPARAVARIVAISEAGRAPRSAPALFALALGAASPDEATRRLALVALPRVARTASHLFEFVGYARALGRGWGRTMKRAVAAWYDAREVDALAFQAVKYRSRAGYDHARLLRTAHPGAGEGGARAALYAWMVGRADAETEGLPPIVAAHEWAMMTSSAAELVPLIEAHRLPWEALPTWAMTDPAVWRAMLPSLGLTALVRNLGNTTRTGAPRAAVAGRGDRGRAPGRPRRAAARAGAPLRAAAGDGGLPLGHRPARGGVVDAAAAGHRRARRGLPRGLRQCGTHRRAPPDRARRVGLHGDAADGLGPDGARGGGGDGADHARGRAAHPRRGLHRGARGALAERGGRVDRRCRSLRARSSTTRWRRSRGCASGRPTARCPCSMRSRPGSTWTAFVVYTDNETWAGAIHPVEALRRYRARTGIPAKLVVVGMTSTGFSIADPANGGMLDVVGFDAAAPAVVADFLRGGPPPQGSRADAEVEAGGD